MNYKKKKKNITCILNTYNLCIFKNYKTIFITNNIVLIIYFHQKTTIRMKYYIFPKIYLTDLFNREPITKYPVLWYVIKKTVIRYTFTK